VPAVIPSLDDLVLVRSGGRWHRAIVQPCRGWAITACNPRHASQVDAASRLALISSVASPPWNACEACSATAFSKHEIDGREIVGVRIGTRHGAIYLREYPTGDLVCIMHAPERNYGRPYEAGRAWPHADVSRFMA
jgi:hypothetical protein